MTDVFDLARGAYTMSRLGGRWAAYWCGCRSERHGVGCGQKEVRKHVRLVLATGGTGEVQSE